jgi:DNA-binding transcriptional MerR regulator
MMAKYPKEMKLRARSLKEQGLTCAEICKQLIAEYPEPGEHLRATKTGGECTINRWIYDPCSTHTSVHNNKITLKDEELGIVESFALIPRAATSDKFNQLTQSIPELLAEKREELERIQKQIRQLEEMSKVLGEELENEEPVEATG